LSFISDWLTEAGLSLLSEIKEGGKDLILKRLGLKEFFSGPKCNPRHKPYSPSVQGWNNGIQSTLKYFINTLYLIEIIPLLEYFFSFFIPHFSAKLLQ
jgi:hypothetical protein